MNKRDDCIRREQKIQGYFRQEDVEDAEEI